MNTHETLVAARNLIDREGWAQKRDGKWWRENDGGKCASNAILRTAGECSDLAAWDVFRDVNGIGPRSADLFAWNDAPGRTKEEVLAAFDAAIAATAPEPADPLAGRVEIVEHPCEVPA